jgi:hypothetical protein
MLTSLACESTSDNDKLKEPDTQSVIQGVADSTIKQPVDSFIIIYNSLPKIKHANSFFLKGMIDHKEDTYYPVFFKELAEVESPDSIQEAYLDPIRKILSIGLGDNFMNMTFFKDSLTDSTIALVLTGNINQFYGEDTYITILKGDSLLNWRDISNEVINRKEIFSSYIPIFKDTYSLNDLFRIKIEQSGKAIKLRINKGKRKWDCQDNQAIICAVNNSQLEDSLVLKWSNALKRYKVEKP